jgi:ribosomal protein S27AE
MESKMICPSCKVEMNHHCDKLVYNAGTQEAGAAEPNLGGSIEEFHRCPRCGDGASRPA